MILPYTEDVSRKSSTPDQVPIIIFDVFKGHMCDSVHTLLENNKVLQVHVTNNCTDLFQPLTLSVNKPFNDKLRSKFSEWYAQEFRKQLPVDTQVEEVQVVSGEETEQLGSLFQLMMIQSRHSQEWIQEG